MHEQKPAVGLQQSGSTPQIAPSNWFVHTPLILAYAGFIGLGLVSSRTGVTWPAMQVTFGLPIDAISSMLIAQLVGSIVVSASSGRLTAWLNIGVMSAWSCGIIAFALLGSGVAPVWELLVFLSILTGLGSGAIESSLNTYAATHFSARSMNWLHACFGIGATLGPALMTALLASNFGWRTGFIVIGVIELLLAICFALTRKYWQSASPTIASAPRQQRVPLAETLRLPTAWLGILLFIAFTGTQASGGQWFYSLLTEQRGVSPTLAGTWVSLYWASLTVGRIVFGFVVQRFAPIQVLRLCVLGSLFSTSLLWLNLTPWMSLASIVLLGFAMAPLFPLLTSATPRYLGQQHAANGVGLQVAAAGLGGVLVTSLIGVLAQAFGLNVIAPALVVGAAMMVGLFELLVRSMANTMD